jgi:hypothetical protein
MSGGNWWRANEISIGHLTHERDVGDRWRDKTFGEVRRTGRGLGDRVGRRRLSCRQWAGAVALPTISDAESQRQITPAVSRKRCPELHVETSGRRYCRVSIGPARKGDAVRQKSGSVGHYSEGGSESGERSVTSSRSAAPPDPERPRRILGASVLPIIALMIGRWSQDSGGGAIRCSARWDPVSL